MISSTLPPSLLPSDSSICISFKSVKASVFHDGRSSLTSRSGFFPFFHGSREKIWKCATNVFVNVEIKNSLQLCFPWDWLDWFNCDGGIITGLAIAAKIFKSGYFRALLSPRRWQQHLGLLQSPCGPKPFPNTGQSNANRLMRDLSTSLPLTHKPQLHFCPTLPYLLWLQWRCEIPLLLCVLECSRRKRKTVFSVKSFKTIACSVIQLKLFFGCI